MKYLAFIVTLLMISMIGFSQPPPDHPALQMRKYYADVYTSSSIVAFESYDLDSILTVVSKLIVPAQVISVYSYVDNPYKYNSKHFYGHEAILAKTLEKDSTSLFNRINYPRYSVSLGSFPGNWKPFKHYRYLSRTISGCDCNR